MTYFVALLLFILVYVVVRFICSKFPTMASIADVLGVVLGVLVALWYVGVIH